MPKKPGRGPKKRRGQGGGSPSGGGGGRRDDGGKRQSRGRRGSAGRPGKHSAPKKSDYFMQPGRQGVFIVLRRPIGNRADPKICGTMPTRMHAKMLIQQLERAESVVKDLFMEATDDGIEALEAVLAACRDEVMLHGPPAGTPDTSSDADVEEMPADDAPATEADAESDESDESPYDESSPDEKDD